jgi:hypothetical protein
LRNQPYLCNMNYFGKLSWKFFGNLVGNGESGQRAVPEPQVVTELKLNNKDLSPCCSKRNARFRGFMSRVPVRTVRSFVVFATTRRKYPSETSVPVSFMNF